MRNARGHRTTKAARRSITSPDELIHIIFHELRTPLSSIHGYVSLLLSGEMGPLPQQQRETVERLRELTIYLTVLLTNLRQLALLGDQAALMSWEPVDVSQLVRSVCRDLEVEAKRKEIRLALQLADSLPPLWAERNALIQILINLIMNAVKFTPERGTVTVAVRGSKDAVRLTVRDTGVGVDPDVLPRLFREFHHQDRPEVGAVGGTGFGLVIVKRSVDRHRGSVSMKSRAGRGSTVEVVLPRHSDQQIVHMVLGQMIQWSRQQHEPFVVVLVKADGMGAERLAQILKESVRGDDRYFPIHDKSLGLIVARTNLKGASLIAERISQRVERDPILTRPQSFKPRLGIAAYPTHGKGVAQLLKAARRHMAPLPTDLAAAG
ncbi:MAG: diguanylate cyclase [Candidatus Omnitrophica bacterium]|nr:diguanylate cyclase [Candidatus Omnitrophota bacterium]